MKKFRLQIFMIFLVFVPIKVLYEQSLQASYDQLNLGGVVLSLELRAKLGQNLAIALLSGFRGIVADFVWLRAHVFWEKDVWDKMRESIELAVLLQPHSISFWDIGSWHMAWNASHGESINQDYPTEAFRLKAQRDWVLAGKEFLERGIKNNPDSYILYNSLGRLIYDKLDDPLGAIPSIKKAASFPEAPLFVGRMVGRMYEKGGKTREAYECWKNFWMEDHKKHPDQLWHLIEEWGREAEEKLNIPTAERVFPPKPKSAKLK